jgi:hypothetical protein
LKWILIAPIAAAVIVAIVILSLLHTERHSLSVQAIVEKNGEREVKRVVNQNTGSESLTNVVIDYGSGYKDNLPLLEPRQKVYLSPPEGSWDNVTVTTNEGIHISKSYEAPVGLVPPGFSG